MTLLDKICVAQSSNDWCVQMRQSVIKGAELDFDVVNNVLRVKFMFLVWLG